MLLTASSPSASLEDGFYLFDVNSTVIVNPKPGGGDEPEVRPFRFDFAVNGDEGVEIRVTPREGQSLIYFQSTDLKSKGFRAANGTFECDFEEKACTDGSQVIRW